MKVRECKCYTVNFNYNEKAFNFMAIEDEKEVSFFLKLKDYENPLYVFGIEDKDEKTILGFLKKFAEEVESETEDAYLMPSIKTLVSMNNI